MSQLVVRVGAAVDRSVDTTFKSVISAARAAERSTSASEQRSTRVAAVEAGKQADAHVKATQKWMATRQRIMQASAAMAGRTAAKEVADEKRAADKKIAEAKRSGDAKVAAEERAEKARTATRDREAKKREGIEARESRAFEREWEKRRKNNGRSLSKGRQERAHEVRRQVDGAKSGVSTGLGYAASAGMQAARFSADMALDIARGAGVNTDLGSHFAANSALQTQAVDVSNSGYMVNDPRNNKRVGSSELVGQARKVSKETAFDPSEVLGGLGAFAGKTGDLATGRDIIKDLAVLSKATGTNLEDMVDAAADVSNNLEDVPDKGAAIVRVMKALAGQGKMGAVEIKDLAVQMAKVAAAAGKFEGSGEENLAVLGGFAQEARAHGGAATATQAATSTQGFADTFAKGARFEAFKAEGIDVNSKTEKGKFRDPRELIIEALQKTKGDTQRMNKMFASATAQRVTGGFAKVFNEAQNSTQGTEQEKLAAGTKAVREEMERLRNAAMGEGEVRDSFNAAMGTVASKAEIFNTKVGEMAEKLQSEALPELEKLGPAILPLIPAMGLLLVPTIKLGTELAKLLGKITGANDPGDDADENSAIDDFETARANIGKSGEKGEVNQEDLDALEQAKKRLETNVKKRHAKTEGEKGTTFDDFGDAVLNPMAWIGMADHGDKGARKNTARLNEQNAQLDLSRVERVMTEVRDHLKNGTLKTVGAPAAPKAPGGPHVRKPYGSK